MTRLLIATLLLATVAVVLAVRNRSGGPTRTMRITARAGVSRNATIVVVEIDGRRLLIGAAANSVNILADLGEAIEPTDGPDDATPGRAAFAPRPAPTGDTIVDKLRSMTTRTVPGAHS